MAMALEELVENGELDARVTVVEHDDRHAAPARHLDALAVDDAGEEHRIRLRRELVQPRVDESRELALEALERVPREVVAERELLVLQALGVLPARHLHALHLRGGVAEIAEEA